MDNNSDSDGSYDKISWEEFAITLSSDSDPEENAKNENLVKNDMNGFDSEKSEDNTSDSENSENCSSDSEKNENLVQNEMNGSDSEKSVDNTSDSENSENCSSDSENSENCSSDSQKNENLVQNEMNGSDSEKSEDDTSDWENSENCSSDSEKLTNEQNNDIVVKLDDLLINSSYETDSVGEGSEPENTKVINMLKFTVPEAVKNNFKKRCSLLVPGAFEFPLHIKLRKDMEIKDIVKDHVLPFLPAKSLARFKAVSKEWKVWISSPFLAHKQTYLFRNLSGFFCQVNDQGPITYVSIDTHSSGIPNASLKFLPESVVIRGSCYGLLLCQAVKNDNDDYYVCNPVNKEYRKIPKPKFYHGLDPAIVLSFEPSEMNIEAHFEIICAIPLLDSPIVYFEIYSSETKEWRLSTSESIELEDSNISGGGFYVNKIAYFVTDSGLVLGFDLKSEVCGVLSLSPDFESNGVLTRIDGELSYVDMRHSDLNGDENEYDLRVFTGMEMGLENEIGLSLNGMHVGPGTQCRVLPFVTNNGDDVAILARRTLWLYHMREDRGRLIGRAYDFDTKYLPFVSSLVHLPPE